MGEGYTRRRGRWERDKREGEGEGNTRRRGRWERDTRGGGGDGRGIHEEEGDTVIRIFIFYAPIW